MVKDRGLRLKYGSEQRFFPQNRQKTPELPVLPVLLIDTLLSRFYFLGLNTFDGQTSCIDCRR